MQWCPGCWNFLVHLALKQALIELKINPKDTVMITWIWCNSKMSQYMEGYWAETLHWRGIPFAIGVKLSNPKLTVISLSWDGDTYWIGLGHLCDNENYALTTGQASATTPVWVKTKSTPDGNQIVPLDPVALLESVGCWFVKVVEGNKMQEMKDVLKEAIMYDWFAHINVQQACPSWKRW